MEKRLKESWVLQAVGLRIIKTVIAVFLSALFMKYVLHLTPFFACIGAVAAMERTISSSLQAAVARNLGTLLGGLLGIAVALFTNHIFWVSLGLIPLICINNALGKQESIVAGAIVYFAVVYLNTTETAWNYGFLRIFGTFMGSLIAIGVNALLFPPKEQKASSTGEQQPE